MVIQEGIINLLLSPLRSLLALLGILVGTASVVAMLSGGKLAEHEALKQFESLGTDLLAVSLRQRSDSESQAVSEAPLNAALFPVSVLKKNGIRLMAPYVQLFHEMQYDSQEIRGTVLGVTGEFFQAAHIESARGRLISDMDAFNLYCVLGNSVYETVRKNSLEDPLGRQLQIGKNIFTIVGTAKSWPQNSFVFTNINDAVMIPAQTSMLLSRNISDSNIIVRLSSSARADAVEEVLRRFLSVQFPGRDLVFQSPKELIARMTRQTEIFTVFLGLIGGISLCVGGIGVMNIMLVSITERKREIGIRRAVGATRPDIRCLFLAEAVMISLFGGVLGVLLGVFISWLTAVFWHWSFAFFLFPPLIGFSVSAATGIFFGIYPAWRASLLDPIEALRAV